LKLKSLFLFLFLVSQGFCFSQEETAQDEKFYAVRYIFAALNYSLLNNRPGAEARVGYNFGVGWDIKINRALKFYIGLEYNSIRVYQDIGKSITFNSIYNSTYVINGLYLPVDFVTTFGQKERFGIGVGVFGELYSIFKSRVSGTLKYLDFNSGEYKTEEVTTGPDIIAANYGFRFSASYQIPAKNHFVFIRPTFTFALKNVLRGPSTGINASAIQLVLGYKF